MIDLKNFISAINQIEEEKGIEREKILETVEMALAAAYKKDYGQKGQIIRVKLDQNSGVFKVWQEKLVVDESMIKTPEEIALEEQAGGAAMVEKEEQGLEEPEDGVFRKIRFQEQKHIMLDEAKKIDPKVKPGDILKFDLEIKEDFGRIAAQTAKQVIIQRIREAERDAVYLEYENKVDTLISGTVQRIEGNTIFFDIGKTTGVMLLKDRMPREKYRIGQRMRLYIITIERGLKGPQVYISRSHPKMLSRLFELEVPEIANGTVQIKALAREPGFRSKIAVTSTEKGIDPIGSCVGQRGTRVSAIIQELGGEKIDIIQWSEDIEEFIANSLGPAKVLNVEAKKSRAVITVSEDQLSLAIGKDGQNVRLAAKLTGWKIDIISKETGKVQEASNPGEEESEIEAVKKIKKTKEKKEKIKTIKKAKKVSKANETNEAESLDVL